VIREEENPDPRYADRFYLVAEVLSESDKDIIESKREIYRAHSSCTCILLIHQDRMKMVADRRTAEGWRSQVLRGSDELELPELGLNCVVHEVYRDTGVA
jgi:Uma2 family endonuclease